MDLGSVDVVLVRPSRPANVAAACRAMKNMGLSALWLAGVEPGFVSGEARNLAYGAWDVLEGARWVKDLREATAGAAFVVGASGREDARHLTPRRLGEEAASLAAGGRMAVVFGPEASGLAGDELALCHASLRIPADPAHPSLNLAQAVLVVAYELRLALATHAPPPVEPRATAGELEAMLDELQEGLLGIGYLSRENPARILAELRRLAARAVPTAREVTLLRGLARQVRWAGARIAATGAEADNPAPVSELRVPTVAMSAEVTCLDGRSFRGRIFVPATSSMHEGPMRAEEWLNASGSFFPFLPDDADAPVLLNKGEVLTLSVPRDHERSEMELVDIDRRVVVECGARQLAGHLHIDMPAHHSRVLDYLNRPEGFLALYGDDSLHFVQKQNITRVFEVREP